MGRRPFLGGPRRTQRGGGARNRRSLLGHRGRMGECATCARCATDRM